MLVRIVMPLRICHTRMLFMTARLGKGIIFKASSTIENKRTPALHFTQDIIDSCAEVKAEIDVEFTQIHMMNLKILLRLGYEKEAFISNSSSYLFAF